VSARNGAERLLAELLEAGAIPLIEGGRLRVEAPPAVLTAARRERLADCLPELRALVATRWRQREECVAARSCRRMSPCAEPVGGRLCLVPATCCLCGGLLPPGRRYLCPACTETSARRPMRSTDGGDPIP
jgi:hypothetical protein